MGMVADKDGDQVKITNLLVDGQAFNGGVKLGDVLSGINGVSLEDCMTTATDTDELSKMMAVAVRPITLNFNKVFAPKPAPIVEQKPKLDPGMQQFKSLMIQGLEVIKHHGKKKGNAKRILYMDPAMQHVYCGKSKGEKTAKVYDIHDSITHIRPVGGQDKSLEIVSKIAKKKGKTAEEVLRIEVPTSKARDLIVDKLGILIRHEKEVKKQG